MTQSAFHQKRDRILMLEDEYLNGAEPDNDGERGYV
jgi:hypothetical protein